MATESFFIDLVLDTPEKYERYLAAMRNRRPIPDFDIEAAERGGTRIPGTSQDHRRSLSIIPSRELTATAALGSCCSAFDTSHFLSDQTPSFERQGPDRTPLILDDPE